MMDFSGLPDQEQPETGSDLLSGLPDTNAGTLRKQYRSTALAPDTAAKVVDLSAKSGLPRVTVERNQLFAERKASEPDWDALESTAPITARTLAANAPMFEIAHDDTENLSSTEKVFGALSRHVKGVAGSLSAGVLNDTNAAVWGWLEGGAKALGADKTGEYFKAQRKFQEEQAAGAQGGYGEAGFAEASVASGVRSLGAMAPGLLAAVMTGNPAFSYGMGSGQAGGQTVGKGLDAGVSPVQSLVYGAEDATAEWATELLPMGLLIRDLKLGAPLYKILARQIATEVPTEIAATAWQNFNEWANLNPEMPFSGYLEKLGPDEALTISSTIVQTILSAGLAEGTSKILQRATAQQDQADSAMKSADGLAQLAKLAAESKLRARDPKTFQAFVEAANEEGGVQDVYLDTNTLLQAGVDLEALAKLSPVVAEQLKQPNIGGDLVIPVGEYAARIAGSEVDTLLAPHLRVSEDALSSIEAQAFYQNQGEEFAKAAQQVMEEKANDTAWTDSAKVVETQLFDQLQQTGRFTADANTAYATLMRDFYVTTAGRLNLTPEEMFAKYPLQISSESKAGGKTMDYGQRKPIPAEKLAEWEGFKTGQPVTFDFVHNTESATRLFGKPKKDAPYGRGVEPSGRYVTNAKLGGTPQKNMIGGVLTFNNPLVLRTDSWKQDLFDHYKKRGKKLSQALISDGYDGVVTINKYGTSEILDLTTFDAGKALYQTTLDPGQFFQGERKNLYTAHNLSAENLRHTLDLGGLAAPSLAVGSIDNSAFTAFGEITLLADPDLLFSPKTKAFDADVYSPRHPRAVHVIDRKKLDTLLTSLGDTHGLTTFGEGDLEESRGLDSLKHNDAFKLAWLREQGVKIPLKKVAASPAVRKIAGMKGGRYELEQNPAVIKLAQATAEKDLANIPEDVRPAVRTDWFGKDGQVSSYYTRKLVAEATRFRDTGGIDQLALRQAISKKFRDGKLSARFEEHARKTFDSLVKERKIFKGFTNSGNRSYSPYTLDNIVKEMTRELRGGEGFNYGAGSVRSAFAKQFKSVAEIQKNRDRVVSKEEMDKIKEESQQKLSDLLDELRPFYKYDGNAFGYMDDASQAIAEGPRGVREAFKDLPAEMSAKINDFTTYLKNLPTEYFEAKMQRAVSLAEFNAAVVPKGTPADLVQALKDRGLEVRFYKKGDESSRKEAVAKAATLFQQHRAEITLADDITQQPTFLSLLKNADLSSFLHEMGHFQLEVLSHIASQPNAPAEITEDLNKILGWFGITGNENVTGGEKSGELGQPDTEAFKKWFGDSKVLDAEGKPLVVYHGTSADFTFFSPAKKGENTGAKSAREGYWFSADATHAAGFNASRVGNNVVPAYLSLKNPLIVDHGKFDAQEAHPLLSTQAEKLRLSSIKKAKKKGHDGVVFKNTFDTFASGETGARRVDLYLAFEPTQIKSAIGNQGTYDPNDPNILRQGDDATPPDTANLPPGRTPLEVWQAMSLEEKRPFHEQFARGFEAYLFEGKAPSVELNGVFARLRSWLINVYKSVVNLRVKINDDLRGVFDRLLATEEAIKQAEEMRAYGALYTSAEQMGMDAEGWAEYQRTGAEATDEAMTTLQKRSLRDMQWLTNARNRTLKKLQQDAKAKRSAVQEEVTAEVQEMPLYAALRFIRQGEGNNVTKLSLPDLKEMYGEEPAAPWRYLPVGLAANEGLAPDRIAELFGFTSGDHLVRSILEQSSEADMIEGMTDQRMLERYGDINSPEALNRAADEAIHNAARARFVATELKALDKSNTPARVIAQAAKAFAEATIARKKLREIRPSQHAAAELRAAKAAQKAMIKGDTRAAAIEKRNQLIQNLSTKEAYNALGEIDKAVRYLRKFDKEGPRKSIDVGYLDQIDQLLERFDFRASVTNKAAKKRESLLAWLEEQRLQGFEPDVPQELQTEALRKPYRELTMEELRGLVDTVKQIEHLGRLKRKLLTSKDAREFQAIRDEIAASIEEHAKKTVDLRTRSNTAEALKSGGKHFLAMHRKMASLARELDGFKDGGPMWEYFIRSMNTAGDLETTKRGEATARLFELVKPLLSGGKMGGKGQYFETLQGSFNREERIAIALNLGNAGNTQRLLDGEGWSMAQLRPLLDTITPEEAAFVQNIWDFFESYRPEIAAKERRVYGKEPDWVEPTPITLGGQQLRGGYYPIRYDANRTGKAEQFAAAEEAKAQMKGAFTSSTTRRSFTKTRAEEVVGRPLVYSFSGLYLGANEVIHDLAWHEWLIDANRLARSLDGVIRSHYGPEGVAVFKKGIEDIAAGDAGAANAFEKGLNHIRTGATIAGLGWNLTTSLFQPLGLLPSMVRVGPGWMAKGIGRFLAHPKRVSEEIVAKDPMMADRAKTMQREISEIQNQIQASKLDPVRATFFVLIQKAQWIADAPTWLGAYEKAVAEGNDEERAVALADQAVLDSQGGGQTKDLAQIQRGGPLLKLWTNFYSYFNVIYNLGAEKTNEKIGSPKLYPSLALDYLLLYIIPAALVTILRDALSGGDDDDLVKKLLADQISNVTGLLIGLRETTAALQKVAGVEQYKGAYGGPAGLRLFQELDKLGQQVGQGEADEALFKAINNVGGIVFHYPSGQVARTVGGAAAMFEGKIENPAALVLGPPRK